MPNPIFNRLPRLFLNRFREQDLAQYSEAGNWERLIPVIFNATYQPMSADGIPFDGTVPTAWVSDLDCPNLSNADTLTINGTRYRADSCKPDGYGMTAVSLKKI